MKMNKEVEKALNEQLKREFESAYFYLAMAAHFRSENLNGFAHWMESQSDEELGHAMKIYNYVFERGGEVTLEQIEKPKSSWKSPEDAFNHAHEHEKDITGCVDKLVELSREEKDYATEAMLQWFVTEQVEEEASTKEVLLKLKMVGDKGQALYLLDKELGKRQKE